MRTSLGRIHLDVARRAMQTDARPSVSPCVRVKTSALWQFALVLLSFRDDLMVRSEMTL